MNIIFILTLTITLLTLKIVGHCFITQHICLHKILFKTIEFLPKMLKKRNLCLSLLPSIDVMWVRKTKVVCIVILLSPWWISSRVKKICTKRRIKKILRVSFSLSLSLLAITMKKISQKCKCTKLLFSSDVRQDNSWWMSCSNYKNICVQWSHVI